MAITVRPATPAAIKAALGQAGIDIARHNHDLDVHNDAISGLLRRDMAEAVALAFRGTPVFLVGPFALAQGLDEAGFRKAVADARARKDAGAKAAR